MKYFKIQYSKICDIQQLQNKRAAGYHSFPGMRMLYLIHIFVYLAISWKDLNKSFVPY